MPNGESRKLPVGVALVHHNVAQVGQEAPKLAVHRQHAAVQHVWVGDQQVRPFPDLTPDLLHTKFTWMIPAVTDPSKALSQPQRQQHINCSYLHMHCSALHCSG